MPGPAPFPPLSATSPVVVVEGGEDVGDTVRLTVAGELDLGTVPELADPLRAAIRTGHRDVAVDVRRVSFYDAAGLRPLTEAAAALRAREGELWVYGPCPAIEVLLEVLAPDTAIEVRPAPSD